MSRHCAAREAGGSNPHPDIFAPKTIASIRQIANFVEHLQTASFDPGFSAEIMPGADGGEVGFAVPGSGGEFKRREFKVWADR
jgi:hypothetical protein